MHRCGRCLSVGSQLPSPHPSYVIQFFSYIFNCTFVGSGYSPEFCSVVFRSHLPSLSLFLFYYYCSDVLKCLEIRFSTPNARFYGGSCVSVSTYCNGHLYPIRYLATASHRLQRTQSSASSSFRPSPSYSSQLGPTIFSWVLCLQARYQGRI